MRDTRRLVLIAVIGGTILALVLMLSSTQRRITLEDPSASAPAPANGANSVTDENPFIAAVSDAAAANTGLESLSRTEAALQITLRLLFAVILSGILAL